MDDRSWLWRHKSPEKSPGETESSGSASSHSDRYSDGQESLRNSPNDISASHVQASEVAPDTCDSDIHETVKRLTEKLSAALLNICAKEDLVKQHAKVAEEAVSGWEQAEAEVAALKQQLETAIQRNTYLEDKIGQLDSALKGCANPVEQDEKVHDSITKKAHERESEKHEVEEHLVEEAKAQLEAAKTQNTTLDHGLEARLEAVERENMVLKSELHSQSEELQVLLLERELSNKAAETASKQHLESIKKVTKLKAECRQLKNINRRLSSASDHKQIASPACLESLTDSQSDSGERLLGIDNELGCSDSWATALIAELDQFKNEKPHLRNLTTSVEIELMDDFLEMERFVALPETESSGFEPEARPDQVTITDSLPKIKTENLNLKLIELEEKLERREHERSELEIALVESRNHLGMSCNMLIAAEIKIADLQKRADLADESKTSEIMDLEGKKKVLETQLELAYSDIGKLSEKVSLLEENYEANIVSSIELKVKLEMAESAIKASDSQLNSANLEVRSLNEAVGTLERKVKEERTLSSELAAKVEASEATKEALESQLRQAYSEITKLKEKVSFLELKAEEERILSAEFAAKLETSEAAKKKLELDFKLAHEFATKLDAAETANKLLEIQLESAEVEIRKLSNNIAFLEEKVDEERALSAEYAAKCHKMESDLLKFDRETDFQRVAHSKQELKIKQGKELAVAAGKLEECQKTIASLNQQLKSLTTMDDLMLEVEMPQHEVGEQGFHHSDDSESELIDTYTFQNGGEKGSLLSSSVSLRSSSSSSNLSQLMRTLSHSRSTTC